MVLNISLPDNYGYVALTAMSTGWLLVVRRLPFQTSAAMLTGRLVPDVRCDAGASCCEDQLSSRYVQGQETVCLGLPLAPRCRSAEMQLTPFSTPFPFLSFRSSIAIRF